MKEFEIIEQNDTICKIKISGKYQRDSLKQIYPHVERLKQKQFTFLGIDCQELEALDYSGAVLLAGLITFYSQQNTSVVIENLQEQYKDIFIFARKNASFPTLKIKKPKSFLYTLGENTFSYFQSFILFLSFLGENFIQILRVLRKPWIFRYKASMVQIEKSGAKALPIVAITSFLVGLVIAYQGAEQLSKFGANIFIVEMVGISIFRELAPLIAAIVIAGRSSSSYTAEIGTMKITDEIDAMQTMGFDPNLFLVLPRIFALVISMPLIVFFADIIGVFGGMIVANSSLNISFMEFITRARDVIELKHVMIGLIKAPFFGLIIALIGCFRGFQVTRSTESIGKYTTISVVNAIFWVIAFNAIISVVLTEVGI